MAKMDSEAGAAIALGCVVMVAAIVMGLAISAGLGALTMIVWNAVFVPMGAPVLSFWVAWALWFVVSVLAGRFRASISTGSK
jgi:hypothetical protein